MLQVASKSYMYVQCLISFVAHGTYMYGDSYLHVYMCMYLVPACTSSAGF